MASTVPRLPLVKVPPQAASVGASPRSARGGQMVSARGNTYSGMPGSGRGKNPHHVQPLSAGGTMMSAATKTRYVLTPRSNPDGTQADLKRLEQKDLQNISAYISANKNLNHIHRSGKISNLIPEASFAKIPGSSDVGLGLAIAPVHPKESALDIPLRFQPPSHFHCPIPQDPRQGSTLSTRVVQLLKGTSSVPQHWSGEKDGEEKDVAHTNVIKDLELKAAMNKRAGNTRNEAMSHFSIAVLFYNAMALDKATQHMLLACNLFEQCGDPQATALCHNLCGICYFRLGTYKMALIHHKKQEELSASYGRAVAQANMGICYNALGEPKYAEQAFLDALANAKDSRDDVLTTIVLGNCGLACMRVGDMSAAQKHFEECLEHCSVAGDKVGAAVCLLLLGEVYAQVSDYEHAQFYYEHSFRVSSDCGCRDVMDMARINIGIARGNQQVKDAVMSTAKKMGAQFGVRDVLLSLPGGGPNSIEEGEAPDDEENNQEDHGGSSYPHQEAEQPEIDGTVDP